MPVYGGNVVFCTFTLVIFCLFQLLFGGGQGYKLVNGPGMG